MCGLDYQVWAARSQSFALFSLIEGMHFYKKNRAISWNIDDLYYRIS